MIISFGDDATADLYHGRHTKRVRKLPHDILHRALVRLDVLNTAHSLIDQRSPPGNRLEALGGIGRAFTVFVSTSSGASSFDGKTETPMTFRYLIIIKG